VFIIRGVFQSQEDGVYYTGSVSESGGGKGGVESFRGSSFLAILPSVEREGNRTYHLVLSSDLLQRCRINVIRRPSLYGSKDAAMRGYALFAGVGSTMVTDASELSRCLLHEQPLPCACEGLPCVALGGCHCRQQAPQQATKSTKNWLMSSKISLIVTHCSTSINKLNTVFETDMSCFVILNARQLFLG
jgi:hypothetical protein